MASGTEMLLMSLIKAAGLQPVLDMANDLARNGTAEKIKRIVDDYDETKNLLKELRDEIRSLKNSSNRNGSTVECGSGAGVSTVSDERNEQFHPIVRSANGH